MIVKTLYWKIICFFQNRHIEDVLKASYRSVIILKNEDYLFFEEVISSLFNKVDICDNKTDLKDLINKYKTNNND